MDLMNTSPQEIGSALDHAGITWSFDDDGDVRVRTRSSQQPWIDAVFYEFDVAKGDWSMRGQFLNGRAVPQSNGMTQWEVPLRGDLRPTAIAQKVVDVYLMPRSGGVGMQVHALIAPQDQPRSIHIKIAPSAEQVSRIERAFPRFVGAGDQRQYWMSGGATGAGVDEAEFTDLVREAFHVGLEMFEGPFTGWMYAREV